MAENIQSGRFLKPALIYVSSLLAPHLVFLPRLPHSQWFPISFFRFFMQSQLLVRASFPRYFSLFPPYLTINKNHLFFIPLSWQHIVQSQTPPGPYLNPLSKIAHFSLLSSMNKKKKLHLGSFYSFPFSCCSCHAMPCHPYHGLSSSPLPFPSPSGPSADCWEPTGLTEGLQEYILALRSHAQTSSSNNNRTQKQKYRESPVCSWRLEPAVVDGVLESLIQNWGLYWKHLLCTGSKFYNVAKFW